MTICYSSIRKSMTYSPSHFNDSSGFTLYTKHALSHACPAPCSSCLLIRTSLSLRYACTQHTLVPMFLLNSWAIVIWSSPLGNLWIVTCTLNLTHIHYLPDKLSFDLHFVADLIFSYMPFPLKKKKWPRTMISNF